MRQVSLFVAALFLPALALGANPPSKSKVHGLSVTGTVTTYEEPSKKMVVKTSAGKPIALVWTSATKTVGGPVKAGLKVTVRYLEKDGKNIATSIQVEGAKLEAATAAAPTPTATASNAQKPQ